MPKKFRYSWYPPLFLKGTMQMVTFSKEERKYTDIQAVEPCMIEEVQTMYDKNGTCEHHYMVRFMEKKKQSISYRNPSGELPQRNLVKESALDTIHNRLLISQP